jgi:periplasmic glucans biosynthesis protein
MQEFSYRLHWGAMPVDHAADLAFVKETRAGVGGVSGVENSDGSRKFVVDFEGGMLSSLPADAKIEPITSISGGKIAVKTLSKIEGHDVWRLVLDVIPDEGATVELGAHVAGFGRKLTEIWIYQWVTA